jgi:uncharacterized delta-60 repeat protein
LKEKEMTAINASRKNASGRQKTMPKRSNTFFGTLNRLFQFQSTGMRRRKTSRGQRHGFRSRLEFLESRRVLSAGDFIGSVSTEWALSSFGDSLAVQADGKVVVVGTIDDNFAVRRYNADRTPDTSFGPDPEFKGLVRTDFGGSVDRPYAVTIQNGGKLVVAGQSASQASIARYYADGSLDLMSYSLPNGMDVQNVHDVEVLKDGRIIVVSTHYDIELKKEKVWLALFTPLGVSPASWRELALDSHSPVALTIDYSGTAATNTNFGTIVVAGKGLPFGSPVSRYKTDFYGGAVEFVDGFRYFSGLTCTDLLAQEDGKIILAGYVEQPGGTRDFALMRFNPDGMPDINFGPISGTGQVTVGFGSGSDDRAYTLAIGDGGKILIGGSAGGDFALARFTPEGILDTTFGNGGKVKKNFGGASDEIHALEIDAGGRIVAFGPGGSGAKGQVAWFTDVVPKVSIVAWDKSANEAGSDPGTFRFDLDRPVFEPTRVYFDVSGSAAANADYLGVSLFAPHYVEIPAGASTASFTIAPKGDMLTEGTEQVKLTLLPGSGYEMGALTYATVNISDAPGVTVTAVDAYGSESGDAVRLKVERSGSTANPLTIGLSWGGTATYGTDYKYIGKTWVIPAGQPSSTIAITPIDDSVAEGEESVRLTLIQGGGYGVASASTAEAKIADNDFAEAPIAGTSAALAWDALEEDLSSVRSADMDQVFDLLALEKVILTNEQGQVRARSDEELLHNDNAKGSLKRTATTPPAATEMKRRMPIRPQMAFTNLDSLDPLNDELISVVLPQLANIL